MSIFLVEINLSQIPGFPNGKVPTVTEQTEPTMPDDLLGISHGRFSKKYFII